MKNTGNREIDELQMRYQELANKTNSVFTVIGKIYYEQNSTNPGPGYAEHFAVLKESVDQMKKIDTRIKFLIGIVVCSNCGLENGVSSSFCAGCGTRLPHTYANDGVNRCSNCGNVVKPGNKFCGNCGAPVVQSEQATPAAAQEKPQTRICPACGIEITESDSLFCPECGTKLV